jgi:hypothetical protein
MNRLWVVLLLVVVGVVGLRFYLGWFQFTSNTADEKPNVTFTLDPEKFQEDKEKVQDMGPSAKPDQEGATR